MSSLSDCSFDDSDDDADVLLRKALDVEFPCNFNPRAVPRDGIEYLHHVMYERNRCKKLVISDIDPNKFRRNQTFTVPLKTSICADISRRLLPSLSWQVRKLDDFKYFKHVLESQDEKKSQPTITTFNEDDFIVRLNKNAPEYSALRQYTQPAKVRMLELIMKYVSKELLGDSIGAWIFGILVTLDMPLSPSSCHVVREFIRTCQLVRSTFEGEMEEQDCAPLNFYICICSRHFGQLDLAD